MQRYLISISYDGSGFLGYQIQNTGRTVQQCIEKAVSSFSKNENIKTTAAGRTDAGVHALNQYVSFDLPITLSETQLIAALNTRLPDDIRVNLAWMVDQNFSARYNAESRSYLYKVTTAKTPFNRNYSAFMPRLKFFPNQIEKCLKLFIGKHDFSTFAKFNPQLKHQICTLKTFEMKKNGNEYIFNIEANRFLHNMVRRLIGTSIHVTHLQKSPNIIRELLESKNPANNLVYTAPPNGLYLSEVKYKNINS